MVLAEQTGEALGRWQIEIANNSTRDGSLDYVNEPIEALVAERSWQIVAQLHGGTASQVLLVDTGERQLVLKRDNPERIRVEAALLNAWAPHHLAPAADVLRPDVIAIDYITNWSDGTHIDSASAVEATIPSLRQAHSIEVSTELTPLIDHLNQKQSLIGVRSSEFEAQAAVKHLESISNSTQLVSLHGDLNTRNARLLEGTRAMFIDPWPFRGDPLYDIAMMSLYARLTYEQYCRAASQYQARDNEELRAWYVFVLLYRIDNARFHDLTFASFLQSQLDAATKKGLI